MCNSEGFNTIKLFINLTPCSYAQYNNCCISFTINDNEIMQIDDRGKIIKSPDATLKIKHDKQIEREFNMRNININYDTLTKRYFIIGTDSEYIRLEDFCKALINEKDGESYDCHNPDLILRCNHDQLQSNYLLLS